MSARIGVLAALSLLVRRERTGLGGAASVAQCEVMLSHLAAELPGWKFYVQRRAFREELHPHARGPYVLENTQLHSERVADPPLGQAPPLGQHTVEIATTLLGLGRLCGCSDVRRAVLDFVTTAVVRSA